MDEITDQRVILEAELRDLKQELTNGDYKIIKCMEAYLVGDDMPYDYDALIAHRKNIRSNVEKVEMSMMKQEV